MIRFTAHCSQRGCSSEGDAAYAPDLCPICRNPLLPGDLLVTPLVPVEVVPAAALSMSMVASTSDVIESPEQPAAPVVLPAVELPEHPGADDLPVGLALP